MGHNYNPVRLNLIKLIHNSWLFGPKTDQISVRYRYIKITKCPKLPRYDDGI